MHSSKRVYEHPRVHRLDFTNRCTLSDCCGAPVIQGGICFDCREHCEEEASDRRPARFGRTSITREDDLVLANGDRHPFSFREEDSGDAFDYVSVSAFPD